MAKVTGLGGIFFKCADPEATNKWYAEHLGLETSPYGTKLNWYDTGNPDEPGYSLWAPFKAESKYFEPSAKEFMINYRVDNLTEMVEQLQAKGVQLIGEVQDHEYGKFAHIMDPEGNKLELWEEKV